MTYSEYIPFQQNAQQAWGHGGQFGQGGQGWGQPGGLGQAAFGSQGYGGAGGWQNAGGWQQNYGGGAPWQQRGLAPHEVGEIIRHLAPLLPMIVNQAQQPHAAFGQQNYGGGFGGWQQGYGGGIGGFGQGQRYLSQHEVGEVVRQILPALPQIVSMLQGQQQGPFGQFGNAMYGGGQHLGGGLGALGQAAYGNMGNAWACAQRQLGQGDVGEVVRQLSAVLPQVISNLQAFNQQQQRAA